MSPVVQAHFSLCITHCSHPIGLNKSEFQVTGVGGGGPSPVAGVGTINISLQQFSISICLRTGVKRMGINRCRIPGGSCMLCKFDRPSAGLQESVWEI